MSSPKLKVTVDTATVSIERVLEALIPIASSVADVALTEIVAAPFLNPRLPGTFRLPSPDRDVSPAEAVFLEAAGASADHGDRLRRLYVHDREGRDVFVTEDAKAFGALGSAQRGRVEELVAPSRIMSVEEFEAFCAARRASR